MGNNLCQKYLRDNTVGTSILSEVCETPTEAYGSVPQQKGSLWFQWGLHPTSP